MSWRNRKRRFARDLLVGFYECGLLRTWLRNQPEGWELVSGLWSPFYINARILPSYPGLFKTSCLALSELLTNELEEYDTLIGVATGGVPLAAGASLLLGVPMGYTRKIEGVRDDTDLLERASLYGQHSLVEGEMRSGDRVVLIDDVVSKFSSKEIALRSIGLEMNRRGIEDVTASAIVVLIDREQGASDVAAAYGTRLVSLVQLRSMGLDLLDGLASHRELEVMGAYMANPAEFQDAAVRAMLRDEALGLVRR